MTDTTDTGGKMYSLAINAPQPLNITFTDGSQLIFPLSGKASFTGDVEESARVFFDAVIRHRDSQLEAEHQRADANEPVRCEGVPQHFHDMIDLQETIDELRAELAALKGDQLPVAEVLSQRIGNDTSTIDKALPTGTKIFTATQKPIVLPKEIEPWEVIDILDPTANPEDYACCVGADMYNAAIKACRESVQAAGGIVKDGE